VASPAFLDANIPLYATGADERLRLPCVAILLAARRCPGACTTSAEALQEVLHVLLRRGLPERAKLTVAMFDESLHGKVEPPLREDVVAATNAHPGLTNSARDRVHVAVMNRLGLKQIISADQSFDGIPGVTRLDPLTFHSWRDSVFGESP
jgi:predicted nucleic acid-binding protein